jgi:hypothetical protein
MYVNVGPWARLLRSMSLRGVFALAFGLLAITAGGFAALFHVPREVMHVLGPILGLTGGIGLAALIVGVFRAVLAGGHTVRVIAAAVASILALGGVFVGYSVGVVQAGAREACRRAAYGYSPEERAAALVEGKARRASALYTFAEHFRHDWSSAIDCAYADTDEERRALGLCPRAITGSEPCRCGYEDFRPEASCKAPRCELDGASYRLHCGDAPPKRAADPLAALGAPAPAPTASIDTWRARLGADDLASTRLVRLEGAPALEVTLRGEAPEDVEAIRERTRALHAKAAPFIAAEHGPAWMAGLHEGHPALVAVWESGEARGITSWDDALARMSTTVDGAGAFLQEREGCPIEINPTTEVSFTPETTTTCKGSVLNLRDTPIDVVVECQPEQLGAEKRTPPSKVPLEKLSLKPNDKGTYELHPWDSRTTIVKHVFHERGKESEPPLPVFNRFVYEHGKAWIALHRRLRKDLDVRFHNPYSSLAPTHRDLDQPHLAVPAGWDDLPAKERDRIAKELWKALSAHYQKWHGYGLSSVHLYYSGDKEAFTIEGGKLKKVEPR